VSIDIWIEADIVPVGHTAMRKVRAYNTHCDSLKLFHIAL